MKRVITSQFFKDFISLITNRGLDSLIGIIVIPYLILKIGEVEYGRIVLAQSIVYLGVAFVNYGLDFLILKKVPLYMYFQKMRPISIFMYRIILLRFGIFLLYLVVYYILQCVFGFSSELNLYFSILSLICLAEVFSVSHFLVVFQNVKILPWVSAFRFLFLFLFTYIFVRKENDAYRYICFYSISYLFSNLVVLFYTVLKYKLHYFKRPSIGLLKNIFKSSPFFISKLNLILSDKLYNILCATFVSLSAAALLDISFKVLSIIIIPVQILSVVILGRFFMRTSQEVIKRVLSFILFFSLFLFIILFIAKRYILTYYSFSLVSDVLWSFSLVLFSSLFANLSVFIGDNIMVSNSLEKQLIKSSIYSSLFVFPLLIITLCFVDNSLFALSVFFLFHKILEFLLRVYYSWNYIN
ncbi:hypothetical protein OXV67_05360 [Bacteroides fragilis]|uniref:hypothetical protein n=1 Tax=Bacteroides hominis TaxID=2763023 RepID=UPI00227A4C10|nr:hypothetical protein [Bacteroides fragilis]MCY6338265.1 hypothetical protein [Bacteroides fragilis]